MAGSLADHISKPQYQANDAYAWFILVVWFIQHFGTFFLFNALPLPLYVLSHTLNLLKGFIIFHDMGHNSFFTNSTLNKQMEWLMSFFVVTPIDWTERHHVHHGRSGNLETGPAEWNDTIWLTVKEYKQLPYLQKLIFRFMREPVLFFTLAPIAVWEIQYRFPFLQVNPTNDGNDRPSYFNSVANTTVGGCLLFIFYLLFGWEAMKWYFVAMYGGQVLGILLFHAQHSYNPAYNVRKGWNRKDSAMRGSSFQTIPWFLKWWFMGIEYHHIHHYTTKVPGYYLQKCHEEAPPGLWEDCGVATLSYSEMWGTLRHTLYDEDKRKFISFYDL